ncbi:MAG TPA: hypothetical protein VNI54_01405 [Thermoanaerobaculia bacterium]|nr:hypothetical protein [Thermoanaerobaculia bacterium]
MRLQDDDVVVVIAPAAMRVDVGVPGGARVVRFATTAEFERWRAVRAHARKETVRGELLEALRLAGTDTASLSPSLREVLSKAAHRHTLPRVKELQRYCSSARAFFRLWAREIPERPSRVLLRARVLLAAHLIESGEPVTAAVRRAGFRSVPQFVRAASYGGARCVQIAQTLAAD